MLDGPKIKAVLKRPLSTWLSELKSQQHVSAALGSSISELENPGRHIYLLPKAQGTQILQALVADLRHREFEQWVERYNDDRFFDRF